MRSCERVLRTMAKGRLQPRMAGTSPARSAPGRGRGGLSLAPRALSRHRPGLRRDLADRAGRRRPHLGGALHDARRPRAQGRDEPQPRRRHRHRCRDLERAAPRRAVGHRRLRPAPALRARQPRSGDRLRGPVPPGGRAQAAAAHPRGQAAGPADLDADDGRGLRRPAPARPRRRQELVLRRRRRALAPPHRPRPRPAGLRLVLQARDRALHGALVRRDRAGDDGRARHRARARRGQLDGRPGRDRARPAGTPSGS